MEIIYRRESLQNIRICTAYFSDRFRNDLQVQNLDLFKRDLS